MRYDPASCRTKTCICCHVLLINSSVRIYTSTWHSLIFFHETTLLPRPSLVSPLHRRGAQHTSQIGVVILTPSITLKTRAAEVGGGFEVLRPDACVFCLTGRLGYIFAIPRSIFRVCNPVRVFLICNPVRVFLMCNPVRVFFICNPVWV